MPAYIRPCPGFAKPRPTVSGKLLLTHVDAEPFLFLRLDFSLRNLMWECCVSTINFHGYPVCAS